MNEITSLPSAGPVRRLAALVYDALLVVAISMGYAAVALLIRVLIVGSDIDSNSLPVGGLWFQIGWLWVIVCFFCLFWHKKGQTLGMQAWRLRLINTANPKHNINPSWAQCLQRCLIAPFSLILLGAGYWWCYIDPKGDSLHDKLTKTQVVLLPKRSSIQAPT